MGADFICIWSEVSDEPEALREMVRHASLNDIKELMVQSGDEYLYEDEIEDDDDEDEFFSRFADTTYRELLLEAIDVVHSTNYRRDLAFIFHKDEKIVVTGGMSWGDLPTESYEDVVRYASIFDMGQKEASMTAREAVASEVVDALNLGG